jgi:hypothetical protein
MKIRKWTKWLLAATTLLCAVFLFSMGCCEKPLPQLPNLKEKAVPDIKPEARPTPPLFTEGEYKRMPLTAKGKIVKNQAEVKGYAEIMETKIKVLKDYIRDLFSQDKEP